MTALSPASSRLSSQQAALVAKALDVRYQVTAAELKRLGISPARVGSTTAVGGPFESVGNASFKALFDSWKKLDQLQDGVIAVPSDKPIKCHATSPVGFGVRSDPFRGAAAMHPGIDLVRPLRHARSMRLPTAPSPLPAGTAAATAIWSRSTMAAASTTRYGHLSAFIVSPGQRITRGQLIGRMGSTGRSTGNHLHYEVRIDGRAVNPIPFMKSTDYVLAMQRRSGTASMDAVALGGPGGGH